MNDTQKTKERLIEELNMVRTELNVIRTLINSLPDHIYAKDTQGHFTLVSAAQARYMGMEDPAELVGKSDFDFYPSELASQYFADEQAIMDSGEPLIAYEEPNLDHRTGRTSWTSTTKVPVRDSEGRVAGIVGISRDITRLKQAEAERERLLTVLERRSTQLETVTEVSRIISGILDSRELAQRIVDLVRERFDLYYVGLFLIDRSGEQVSESGRKWAQLAAGTGQAGRKMRKQGHMLEVGGSSMIGQCIATGDARVALDVGEEAVHFKNPLLPKTRSELALPLISRGQTIGALSIQSFQEAAFTEEDISIFQTMASQLANAIENSRLFQQTQDTLEELEAINRSYVRQSWGSFLRRHSSDE
jgi:PAS domain S-box-containing protein